jgi:CheY-like chemotaxis protein
MRLSGATVLVVDDEPELLEIFSQWLQRSECRVFAAPNGAEALKLLEAERVDALISDLGMPIVDGLTLVRRIEEMGLAIPSKLLLSGFADVDMREIYALGVETILEKPLRRRDLLSALEHSLLERDELWLTPMLRPMRRNISIDIESLDETAQTGIFELGRGGCCLLCPRSIVPGETIDLTIRVPSENVTIRAQCEVRWYCAADRWAGLEFLYLEPPGRSRVIECIKHGAMRSFIPGFFADVFPFQRKRFTPAMVT